MQREVCPEAPSSGQEGRVAGGSSRACGSCFEARPQHGRPGPRRRAAICHGRVMLHGRPLGEPDGAALPAIRLEGLPRTVRRSHSSLDPTAETEGRARPRDPVPATLRFTIRSDGIAKAARVKDLPRLASHRPDIYGTVDKNVWCAIVLPQGGAARSVRAPRV